ncbi:MAG: SUMF1/EgtB/PvdO family nonheme iron enzyme [Cyanobacteria bacterium]|jgi:formylglycine-generating enzyme required for sulfatase activity|nr:SUMF1/EgtB/PvdO family nonheme iron enzyme [Cyanobacteria bacterium GSL.Bin21]
MAHQPKDTDAVLGGKNTPQRGLVLGGIEGVKQRLQAPDEDAREQALHQALNYGEEGLALAIASLKDKSLKVSSTAYELLLKQPNPSKQLQTTLDNYGKLPPMVYIPGGSFLMGAPETEEESYDHERPQHRVEIAPFYMGRYPVTQRQYQAVMGENPSYFKGENNPVERVSWYKAKEFCQKLSKQTRKTYQLPSEAQWEYACRAGTTTPFYFGETISTDLANYNGNYAYGNGKKGIYRQKTTPVGSFPPNAFGLYDMHGNVWEWCEDIYHDNYEGAPTDGSPWLTERNHNTRVLRGGSWYGYPRNCRCALRNWLNPVNGYGSSGFRVVSPAVRTL